MEWRDYSSILRKHRRLIILAIVACGLLAGFFSLIQQQKYEGSASLTVTSDDVVSMQLGKERAAPIDVLRNALNIVNSPELAKKVIAATRAKLTPVALSKMVRADAETDVLGATMSADNKSQVPIVRLVVTDTSKDRAIILANAYMAALIQSSEDTEKEYIAQAMELIDINLAKNKQLMAQVGKQVGSTIPTLALDGTVSLAAAGSPNMQTYAEWGRVLSSYNSLNEQKDALATLEVASSQPQIRVAQYAQNAVPISQPWPVNILLGLLVGLPLGVGGAGVLEYSKQRPRRTKEIETLFKAPTLGYVDTTLDFSEAQLIKDRRSPGAEDYRMLRTSLKFQGPDGPGKAILVVSPTDRARGTIVLANLAASFAQAGNKVLVVAGNLRESLLPRLLCENCADRRGLSDWLLSGGDIKTVVLATGVPNLALIPPGTEIRAAAELLDAGQVGKLLRIAERDFDVILLDAPPVLESADAVILAQATEGVVLVVTQDDAKTDVADLTLLRLNAVNANVIGVVDATIAGT
jgi:capsular exopolysaccharide synthesis family protein